jgi:hypothetical protein
MQNKANVHQVGDINRPAIFNNNNNNNNNNNLKHHPFKG